MAVRTTDAAVKVILSLPSGDTTDLSPFIAIANELVTECCSASGYTETRLELIERWMSAHFYMSRDPRLSDQAMDEYSEKRKIPTGQGFSSTYFGQTALRLDTAGNLAVLDASTTTASKKKSTFFSLSTPPDESIYNKGY